MNNVLVSLGVGLVASVVFVYDVITLPIYAILDLPWRQIRKAKKVRARQVPSELGRFRNYDEPSGFQLTMKRLNLDTVEKIMRYAVKEHQDKPGFGTREILSEESELQPSGKVFKKFVMGDFKWLSYVTFGERAESFGRALLMLGVEPGGRVAIFAETRVEWLIAAMGAFTQRITVVTLYATLSEDAVAHGIKETEVAHVITSHALSNKVKSILAQCPKVKHVIYMEDQRVTSPDTPTTPSRSPGVPTTPAEPGRLTSAGLAARRASGGGDARPSCAHAAGGDGLQTGVGPAGSVPRQHSAAGAGSIELEHTDVSDLKEDVSMRPFSEVLSMGDTCTFENHPPTRMDTAIIMYTSGSTGTPKGVMVSHFNMISTMTGFAVTMDVRSDDVYLAYLPLAHVLELMAEMCSVMFGIRIGYSSPLTLMDKSSKVKRGCKGDCSLLKPTLMTAVPMVLDRVSQGIREQMHQSGRLAYGLFSWAVQYRSRWRRRGFSTPILHRLLFSRVAELLGGRVRAIITGGAPLSEATHDLIRSCMNATVMQGYGLTETTSCATLMDEFDIAVGRVGSPVICCDVKLISWEEGGYSVADKPHPRGEIVVGGDNVTMGYFKQPEMTAKEFSEEDGRRWFLTGDIGEFYPNGTLKIIDRKKDLVKLQAGEYVSLGRVETILSTSPLVDNMFVYGESSKNFVVAVVLPNPRQLIALAHEVLGAQANGNSYEELCKMERMEEEVQKRLVRQARVGRLDKMEIPARVSLTTEAWTPDNHLVTAAFKLKRKELSNYYSSDLKRLYQ